MSNLIGDDMEEIFRKASERYPLRTDKSDWSKVVADLDRDPSLILSPLSTDGEERRKKRFFWLFLLLPLGGLGYYSMQMASHNAHAQDRVAVIRPSAATSAVGKAGNSSSEANVPSHENSSKSTSSLSGSNNDRGLSSPLPAVNKPTGNSPAASEIPSGTTPEKRGSALIPLSVVKNSDLRNATKYRNQISAESPYRSVSLRRIHSSGYKKNNQFSAARKVSDNGDEITNKKIADHSPVENMSSKYGRPKETTESSDGTSEMTGEKSVSEGRSVRPVSLKMAAISHEIAVRVNVQARKSTAPTPTKLARSPKASSFYLGLLVAPDFSTVKLQTIKGTGTTFGLLLGYNIDRKWAIETGLYLDRKKYYTDGEYFSTKKINIPSNEKIGYVNGVCNMWEIPLNVRYNFGGQKMKWFATGGLSTYLMTRENYNYQLESNTTGVAYPYSKQYNSHSNYLFSILNVSIGFEQSLGKVGNLRIEPYMRVPLAGLGTGSLPIMSAGLNVGITRRIW